MYDKKEEGEAREMAQTHKKKLPWKRKREREGERRKKQFEEQASLGADKVI